jgi:hypothetical protein
MLSLPYISPLDKKFDSTKRLLVLSEGFEERSLSFISECKNIVFNRIIICKYNQARESKYEQLVSILSLNHENPKPVEIEFNRFVPFEFENNFQSEVSDINNFDEVVVDISVMSKYLIMQIMYILSCFTGRLRIVYTEPISHAPSKEDYEKHKIDLARAAVLPDDISLFPSSGVHNVIRTPLLTSTVMQKSPVLLVSFLSFNEQLIRSLLLDFSPMHLYLVNSYSQYYQWKEQAMLDIHKHIIKEYQNDNPLTEGLLSRRTNMINYQDTFDLLAGIYSEHCIDSRIVLSPTGTKMQALGCALIKICCPDIHIEYPTPESYYVDGYSSSKIRQIHQVVFNNLPKFIGEISEQYKLNG